MKTVKRMNNRLNGFFYFFLLIALASSSCHSNEEKKADEDNKPNHPEEIKIESIGDSIDVSAYSDITCPKCGFTKNEKLPTSFCLIKYACTKCKHEMVPDEGDCCVFCTYGTHKCPSMQ